MAKPLLIRLADAVLIAHALLAAFIVCGLLAIWLGALFDWDWVHRRLFRVTHLILIAVVALLSLLGIACPLTTFEDWLRGGSTQSQGFIQRWVSRLLFYDLPGWFFTVLYVAFGLLVWLTWRWVPPHPRNRASLR